MTPTWHFCVYRKSELQSLCLHYHNSFFKLKKQQFAYYWIITDFYTSYLSQAFILTFHSQFIHMHHVSYDPLNCDNLPVCPYFSLSWVLRSPGRNSSLPWRWVSLYWRSASTLYPQAITSDGRFILHKEVCSWILHCKSLLFHSCSVPQQLLTLICA